MTSTDHERIATRICQSVAEIPDRSSPDDWPEAMLVTADELHTIVMCALALAQNPVPTRQNDKPPMHWSPDPRYDRRPQTAEEWDWRRDAPGNDGVVFERSTNRLNFAYCHADPHAPDQMALVLRCDLGRVLGRLTHYTAHRDLLMQQKTEGEALLERAANEAYRICAETRHVSLGDKVANSIRALFSDEG